MKKPFFLAFLSLLLTALLLSSASCAALREQAAYNNYINSQVENYEFSTPFPKVWKEAHRLLVNNGYRVNNSHSRNVLITDWRSTGEDSHIRYIVTGQDFSDGKCAVTFEKEIEHYNVVKNTPPASQGNPPPPPSSGYHQGGNHPPSGYSYGNNHPQPGYNHGNPPPPPPSTYYRPTYSRIERDYNMEIQLINKVEPANMTQIRREASAYSKSIAN